MQIRTDKNFGGCGCGRSPTGICCGWHGLSESVYQERLKIYKESKKQEDEDLREWQRQAQELWFKDGSCTGDKSE
jgi:hypothetical protein